MQTMGADPSLFKWCARLLFYGLPFNLPTYVEGLSRQAITLPWFAAPGDTILNGIWLVKCAHFLLRKKACCLTSPTYVRAQFV